MVIDEKSIELLINTMVNLNEKLDKLENKFDTKIDRLDTKINMINEKMVTKLDCKNNQKICNQTFQIKKNELSTKKIIAYTSLITAVLGGGGIAAIIKIFFS